MKKSYIILSVAVFSSVLSAYWLLDNNQTGLTPFTQDEYEVFLAQYASAENPSNCPTNFADVQKALDNGLKIPKWIVGGYSVQDAVTTPGGLSVYYAPGPICGEYAENATEKDIIEYHTAGADSHKSHEIQLGETYFDNYQMDSSIEDIQRFQIDGKPAMGWEITTGLSVTMWGNGTVLDSHRTPRPAEITIIDPEGGTFTVLRGWTSLDNLKKMAESVF